MKKLLILTALCGCTTVDSDDILTSGIYADIAARATGDGTTVVSATLYLDEPINLNFVELTGDDQLVASYGDEEKVMIETELLGVVTHHAEFQSDLEDDEFVVSFLRNVDGGAPASIATLPAPFEVDPVAGEVSRAEDLVLTWAPAGTADLMDWIVEGSCIELAAGPIDGDGGSVTIPADALTLRQGSQVDTCDVTVTLTRSRLGSLDPGYGKGGDIRGAQVRAVTFTSTP